VKFRGQPLQWQPGTSPTKQPAIRVP
jgi:hypothetical protein